MLKLGVIMNPIATINPKKDSTLALLREAQARHYQIFYMEREHLAIQNHRVMGDMSLLTIKDKENDWFERSTTSQTLPLSSLDLLLMRQDPPFDMSYIYMTYLLELAQQQGTVVANNPRSVRDANEKLFIHWFPECIPETFVSSEIVKLKMFLNKEKDIIIKPLGSMAGQSIFRVKKGDPNASVIMETLTGQNKNLVMAQRFIPEISLGDKRIILINGQAIPYALLRIPAADDFRGNIAMGATTKIQPLSKQDQFICNKVGPTLKEKGLYFVGIDVIGPYLTEINVTSPTGIREIEAKTKVKISAQLFEALEKKKHDP